MPPTKVCTRNVTTASALAVANPRFVIGLS
jgi:hypothetical protein